MISTLAGEIQGKNISESTPMARETIVEELQKKAALIRLQVLDMIVEAKKGHIGGAFSCTDILVSLYYGGILRIDPAHPKWEERDRFILSKGHSGSALFAILADLGFFERDALATYCKNGTFLGGHPDRRVPGIEVDTGSLGHGLGIGAGMALGAKLNAEDHRIFVLLGDGECCEGSVWEALIFANHHKLGNLIIIIDRNSQCVLDYTEDCSSLDPLTSKLEAFGCDVKEVNGHAFDELLDALSRRNLRKSLTRPLAIVANTIKGKGVSFMERIIKWHHSVPNVEEYAIAKAELSGTTKV
jgi:transketolase